MLSGGLDAVIHYIRTSNLVDRSIEDLWNHPDIRPLFPDQAAEGGRYYRKTGIYPINHGMVIKREIAEKHPWIVLNVLKAFDEANNVAEHRRMEHIEYHRAAGLLPDETLKALRQPLLQHGIKHNRLTLETAARYSLEQGLTPRLMKLDELFAASTLDE